MSILSKPLADSRLPEHIHELYLPVHLRGIGLPAHIFELSDQDYRRIVQMCLDEMGSIRLLGHSRAQHLLLDQDIRNHPTMETGFHEGIQWKIRLVMGSYYTGFIVGSYVLTEQEKASLKEMHHNGVSSRKRIEFHCNGESDWSLEKAPHSGEFRSFDFVKECLKKIATFIAGSEALRSG
jgi:hypothetical protein